MKKSKQGEMEDGGRKREEREKEAKQGTGRENGLNKKK